MWLKTQKFGIGGGGFSISWTKNIATDTVLQIYKIRPTDWCKAKQRYPQWHSISNSNKFKLGNKYWVRIFISQSQSFKSQQHQSQRNSVYEGMRMTLNDKDMTFTISLLNHLMFAVLNSHSDYLITLICGYIALKLCKPLNLLWL